MAFYIEDCASVEIGIQGGPEPIPTDTRKQLSFVESSSTWLFTAWDWVLLMPALFKSQLRLH